MRLRNDKRRMNNGSARNVADMAAYHAQLTTGILLSRGSGTLTFTRATAATYADWEGVIRYAISGQTRHPGCRVVKNIAPTNVAGWASTGSVSVTSGVSDPDGGVTAYTITATGASGFHATASYSLASGGKIRNSCWVRRRTGSGQIQMYNGSDSSGRSVITITSAWQRIAPDVQTSGGAGGAFVGFLIVTSGDAIDVWQAQTEDVTGQSNQAPGEYVSVGVLSYPYHGMGVDGIKGFSTLNGNTVV